MSSTCFELESSSSGRRRYIQLRYGTVRTAVYTPMEWHGTVRHVLMCIQLWYGTVRYGTICTAVYTIMVRGGMVRHVLLYIQLWYGTYNSISALTIFIYRLGNVKHFLSLTLLNATAVI